MVLCGNRSLSHKVAEWPTGHVAIGLTDYLADTERAWGRAGRTAKNASKSLRSKSCAGGSTAMPREAK